MKREVVRWMSTCKVLQKQKKIFDNRCASCAALVVKISIRGKTILRIVTPAPPHQCGRQNKDGIVSFARKQRCDVEKLKNRRRQRHVGLSICKNKRGWRKRVRDYTLIRVRLFTLFFARTLCTAPTTLR